MDKAVAAILGVGIIVLAYLYLSPNLQAIINIQRPTTFYKFTEPIDLQAKATGMGLCNVPQLYIKFVGFNCTNHNYLVQLCCPSGVCGAVKSVGGYTSTPAALPMPPLGSCNMEDITSVQLVSLEPHKLTSKPLPPDSYNCPVAGTPYYEFAADGVYMQINIVGNEQPNQFACPATPNCTPTQEHCSSTTQISWTTCVGDVEMPYSYDCAKDGKVCMNATCVAQGCVQGQTMSTKCASFTGVDTGYKEFRCDGNGIWQITRDCPICSEQTTLCEDGTYVLNTLCDGVLKTDNACSTLPIQEGTGIGTATGTSPSIGTGSSVGTSTITPPTSGTGSTVISTGSGSGGGLGQGGGTSGGGIGTGAPITQPPTQTPPTDNLPLVLVGVAFVGAIVYLYARK